MKDNVNSDLLAALLGKVDALFNPTNFAWPWHQEADQAQWQRRDKYLGRYDWTGAGLLPWSNPGEDMNEKKRISRAMSALKDQGLVRIEGKTAGLTAEGLKAARKICGHLQLEDCLPGLDVMLSFIGGPDEWKDGPNAGYVSEASLAGYDPMPTKGVKIGGLRLPDSAYWTTDALIPLAVADLIDHDFKPDFELPLYCLTKEGRKLAEERRDNKKADPKAWPKLKNWVKWKKQVPLMTESAWEAWWGAYQKEDEAKPNMKPLEANRVKHHLGRCLWPDSMLKRTGPRLDAEKDEGEE